MFKFKFKGQIFLMSILVLSVVLIAGLILMTIFTKDLRRSVETSLSVEAFYAADSGMEWQLYNTLRGSIISGPSMTNNTSCDCQNNYSTLGNIQCIGIASNIRRGIEVNF